MEKATHPGPESTTRPHPDVQMDLNVILGAVSRLRLAIDADLVRPDDFRESLTAWATLLGLPDPLDDGFPSRRIEPDAVPFRQPFPTPAEAACALDDDEEWTSQFLISSQPSFEPRPSIVLPWERDRDSCDEPTERRNGA